MKFWTIFRYECLYQLRRPFMWLIIVLLILLDFLMARDGSFTEALYSEFFFNSPFAVAKTTVFGGLLWLLMGGAIAGEAAARDVATGMHPITYTIPVSKAQHLGARFLAALALNATILLSVQISILLGVYLPGVHPDIIGPFRPEAFLTSYLYISLPSALFVTAIQFSLALWSGRPIAAYVGNLLLFFTAFFIASLILFRSEIGTIMDPIGVRFIWDDLSHLWTTTEKNYRLLTLDGLLLKNRITWIIIGFTIAAITYWRFSFSHRSISNSWLRLPTFPFWRATALSTIDVSIPGTPDLRFPVTYQKSPIRFGVGTHASQIAAIAWRSLWAISTSWMGLFLLGAVPLMTIAIVLDQMTSLGVPLTPTTARVLMELTGPLSAEMSRWIVVPGFIIFFAGELIWREREVGVDEITDAMPGSDWAPLIGKLLGLVGVLIIFMLALTTAGVLVQLIMGYDKFELSLYLKVMFGLQLTEYIIFTILAIAIHVAVNQKYVGHVVAIVVYAFIAALATMLGIEHNMLIYGAGPAWSYTEMSGFASTLWPWLWFKLYWAAWALLIAVIAKLLWVRGKEKGFRARIEVVKQRFVGSTRIIAIVAGILILAFGGFVFYNTNILNEYLDKSQLQARSAKYEHQYGMYANVPQPELTGTTLNIEIYSKKRVVEVVGKYRLVNNTGFPIDSIHIVTPPSDIIVTRSVSLSVASTLALHDEEFGHRIFVLDKSLRPGDSLQVEFATHVQPRGFTNHGNEVMANGSHFRNEWFPHIGYMSQRQLIHAADRRKHGLPPRPIIASLAEANDADLSSLRGGISLETIVGTDEGEVGVAPGLLKRTWKEDNRSYHHYATSAPIGEEWHFFAAAYEITKSEWKDSSGAHVTIQMFHDRDHTGHLERMMNGIKSTLTYYSEQFGPYPYKHLTVVEHPAAPGTGMHASASMFYHGQATAHWIPKNKDQLDFPYAVLGHEMGHQWSMPYAVAEGAPFLAEGLAWYFGFQLVKATRGEEELRRLLSFMRLPYPHQPIRRGEPLLRALDPYMSYRKGPFAMYTLTEYAGTEAINGAIKKLKAESDSAGAKAVTTLHLYRELKAVVPDSAQYLLHDLFEVNTYWLFETKKASAIKSGDNEWHVTIDFTAKKMVYDSAGVGTEVALNEWIPVGVFGARQEGHYELASPLYFKKHLIRSGDQSITVTVNKEPVLAGIDPYHLLDVEEQEEDENVEPVIIR